MSFYLKLKKTAQSFKQPLRVGYLPHYDSVLLKRVIARFLEQHEGIEFQVSSGNHEDLYEKLLEDKVELVLSDQRRSFSNHYQNVPLQDYQCYIAVSKRHQLAQKKQVDIQDLQKEVCILIAAKDQREHEGKFYQELLQYHGTFLYAETKLEAQMMAMNLQGCLIVEERIDVEEEPSLKLIPIMKDGSRALRNYCAFWKRENNSLPIDELVQLLKMELNENVS